MSKYVVLVSISLFTTFIALIIAIIRINNFDDENEFPKDTGVLYFQLNWMFIDMTSNLLCFMTQFAFFKIGNDIYYKRCTWIDSKCQNFVKYYTIKKMKSRQEKHAQQLQQQKLRQASPTLSSNC